VPLEELLVHRNSLDRVDRFIGHKAQNAIDQQQGIAVRKRRHHLGHVIVERCGTRAVRLIFRHGAPV
jgi:hypothetical protein